MKSYLKKNFSFCLLFFFLFSPGIANSPAAVQEEIALNEKLAQSVVKRVGGLLEAHYIFPDVARKMAEYIKSRFDDGKYKILRDVNALARALTNDLRRISKDKHIRVNYSPETVKRIRASRSRSEAEREREQKLALEGQRRRNFGFRKLEILPGNVGYLDLTGFAGMDEAADTIIAAMNFLANAESVIIDLRNNGGGSPFTIQIMSSYFLEESTHLNSFQWRGQESIVQFWTLPHVPGRKMFDTDLYILTSRRTFSAAEEFTYNLKNLKRATIVGETTGGGAHPGGSRIVDDHFLVWVPSGRAINPITKTNWEGTGIEPHIKVDRSIALQRAHYEAVKKRLDASSSSEERRWLGSILKSVKKNLDKIGADKKLLNKAEYRAVIRLWARAYIRSRLNILNLGRFP